MAGPPRKGFNFHPPQLQPTDGTSQLNSIDALVRQASLGANTARMPITWATTNYQMADIGMPPLQTSVNGTYNEAQVNYLKAVIDYVRQHVNRQFSIVANFGGGPDGGGPADWAGSVDGGRYSESTVGWDQLGKFVSTIVNKLNQNLNNFGDSSYTPPNRCVAVQFYNEPNFTLGKWDGSTWIPHNGATEVPASMYGGMAAYVTYWLYQCCGGLTPSGDLKITPVFGDLALGGQANAGIWTEEMSPTLYYDQFSFMTNAMLGQLLQSNLQLADKLRNAWRLSIHPYPKQLQKPGGVVPADWPTNPTIALGDRTGIDAANTILDRYLQYQALDPARKIWITETGVSSNKVSEQGQKEFFQRLGLVVAERYANNDTRLEGFIIFGLTDLDPAVCDQTTPFFQFGVISGYDGSSGKPAANEIEFNFLTRWN